METIHLKTVDPVGQNLLRSAAGKGVSINWERYERLQPQDGFLRLGLSCPYGCMQGPCRIDPFGRGPAAGICGLDRDSMVAAMLLRICVQGASEALSDSGAATLDGEISFPAPLKQAARKTLSLLGASRLSAAEVIHSMSLLNRPDNAPEKLIRQALRLCLLTLALAGKGSGAKQPERIFCEAGYGLVAGRGLNIGIAGRPDPKYLKALQKEAGAHSSVQIRMVSLGEWIPMGNRFVPLACTSGEAELLISSGAVHLLVAGAGADPGLEDIAREMNVPVIEKDNAPAAKEALDRARQAFGSTGQSRPLTDPALRGEGWVTEPGQELTARLKDKKYGRLVLIGGADSLRHALGYLPVELAGALRGRNVNVAGWGDAAAWMIKSGLAAGEDGSPVLLLNARRGPLQALQALASLRKRAALAGICFTGIKDCLDFCLALGLSALGCRVCLADPVPIMGSRRAVEILEKLVAECGGRLLHFDHPAEALEIVEWLTE